MQASRQDSSHSKGQQQKYKRPRERKTHVAEEEQAADVEREQEGWLEREDRQKHGEEWRRDEHEEERRGTTANVRCVHVPLVTARPSFTLHFSRNDVVRCNGHSCPSHQTTSSWS